MDPIHLYRAILRQAGYLPHAYLQAFVKGRTSDYFRRHGNSPQPLKYLSRARADLRRLERINRGERKPFMSLLRHAYGRTGRLRHELLQSHLPSSDPTLSPREPIIPSKPSSGPPNYPKTLVSLLTSPRSITTDKPLSAAELFTPRTLPERALNPASEEARLLGPFSLRRLANIHQRQFKEQIRRVLPPLEVQKIASEESQNTSQDGGVYVPQTGLEQYNPVGALVKLASPGPSTIPRRASRTSKGAEQNAEEHMCTQREAVTENRKNAKVTVGRLANQSPRWLRRRYRELLSEIPSITVDTRESVSTPKYKVGWASPELALAHDVPRQLRLATSEELEWIRKAESER